MSKNYIPLFFICSVILSCSAQLKESKLIEVIPFELIDDTILIKLSVNNSGDALFIFDTGAGGTLISKSFGEKLNLKNGFPSINTGASGIHKVDIYHGNTITIGDTRIKNIPLIKDRKDFTFRSFQRTIDGIVGYDILSKYVTKINYRKKQLELYGFNNFNKSGFGKRYAFTMMQNIPFIFLDSIQIGKGFYSGKLLIDTGAQPNLIFNAPFVKEHKINKKVGTSFTVTGPVGTSNTKTTSIICKIPVITIFQSKITQIPTVLATSKKGAQNNRNYIGIIGNGILKKFDITLNYSKKELFVKPNQLFNQPFKMNCFGAFFIKEGIGKRLIIKGFVNNSPAQLSSLKIGDEILEINDIPVLSISSSALRSILSQNGNEITIKYKRDKETHKTKIKLKSLI